ncbi:MAG TPA: acyloxyacyl hydrolase [Steroidobacteraceae bacterium]|nr:acyloxyacyl hydrolase [Steroidobacteraceae bacterium]
MRKLIWVWPALAACVAVPGIAVAGDSTPRPSYLVAGVGYAGILRGPTNWVGNMEYRWREEYAGLRPKFVFGFTHDARYYNLSIVKGWHVGNDWRLALSTGPGYFQRDRGAPDLGSKLEFLSSIELSRELVAGQRIGIAFQHISNAHLGRINPGSEILQLSYALPVF